MDLQLAQHKLTCRAGLPSVVGVGHGCSGETYIPASHPSEPQHTFENFLRDSNVVGTLNMCAQSQRIKMATTTAPSRALPTWLSRYNLGPLTTQFTPTPACATGFVSTFPETDNVSFIDRYTIAFYSDCISLRPCLPGTSTWQAWAFYSPGLQCPFGWKTVVVLSQGVTSNAPTFALNLLQSAEVAAVCCPE